MKMLTKRMRIEALYGSLRTTKSEPAIRSILSRRSRKAHRLALKESQ